MSKKHICKFCKKEYKTLSTLTYHQKNTKSCIEIQERIKNENHICEYCDKEFTSKKLVNQHLEHCKNKREAMIGIKFEKEIEKIKSEYHINLNKLKNEIDKLKNELEFKDKLIAKYEKENEDYRKLLTRPTTVVNNRNNNYQVQYNHFVQTTEPLTTDMLSNKIKGITKEEMDQFNLKRIEESVSDKLSDIFQDFTFCTDLARKIVAVKKEDQTIEKMHIDKFINKCLELGIPDIRKFIDSLVDHITDKLGSYEVSDDDFTLFDTKCDEIKEFISNNGLNIETTNNPLKQIPNKVITRCRQLNKN
jgi:hypothetical protein